MQTSVSPQYTLPQPEQLTPQAFLQEVKTTLDAAGVAYTDIVLFGSRARGTHHEWSDYDVLIVVPGEAPTEFRLRIHRLLRECFRDRWICYDTLILSELKYRFMAENNLPLYRDIDNERIHIPVQ